MEKRNNGAAGRMTIFDLVVIGLAVVLAIILFYAGTASAKNTMGDVTGNTGVILQSQGQCLGTNCTLTMAPTILQLSGPSCLIVQPGISLCSDGTVTVPAGMKMDAAARRFVDELRRYWPTVCGGKKP